MYKIIKVVTPNDVKLQKEFLSNANLGYEENDYSVIMIDNDKVIGNASIAKNVIKMVALNCNYQGEGLINKLIIDVVNYASSKGINDLFAYSKPENNLIFTNNGFNIIKETKDVTLFENSKANYKSYLDNIGGKLIKGDIAALVMNLNPITLGHKYIIEKAAKEHDHLHLFIVKEDMSIFPYKTRLNLLKNEVKDIKNITIHKGSEYVISAATFPTYFYKDQSDKVFTTLDASIFNDIIKALEIDVRYVGTEPACKTTNAYNKALKEVLNCKVVEVERLENKNGFISATKVREALRTNDLDSLKVLVDNSTFNYLTSQAAKPIIEAIKATTDM